MTHFIPLTGTPFLLGVVGHYNFVRIHQSLRITPAMAAGVTKTLWSLTDMVRVIEDWEAARSLKISGETMVG
jgi:hypothetical protein